MTNIRKLNEEYLRSQYPEFYARLDRLKEFGELMRQIGKRWREDHPELYPPPKKVSDAKYEVLDDKP